MRAFEHPDAVSRGYISAMLGDAGSRRSSRIPKNVNRPSEQELTSAIVEAARRALKCLFERHKERFYYITLFTSGECLPPNISAWSVEALERATAQSGKDAARVLKWSYADSPYFAFREEDFADVQRLYALRPDPHSLPLDGFLAECALRLRAMESALAILDQEGLFGVGQPRASVVVNAEVMPPDRGNTERARRLNPPEALTVWLQEAAEL